MIHIPEERPSIPSLKSMALIIPNINRIVTIEFQGVAKFRVRFGMVNTSIVIFP